MRQRTCSRKPPHRSWWALSNRGCLTCSLLSSFRASLTLPMLPAPMVLPRIHLPDWVGIVVRDLDCLEAEALASAAAPCGTGAGPALLATAAAVMSAVAGGGGKGGAWEDRWLLRRWGRDESAGGGPSLAVLRFPYWATLLVS